MRNYKILNRPMFNKNNSAYGRGIAANLVTQEERQRFNYGGRVRAWDGMSIGSGRGANYNYGQISTDEGPKMINWWDVYSDPEKRQDWEWEKAREKIDKQKVKDTGLRSPQHPANFEEIEELKKSQITEPANIEPTIDPDSDQLFTDEEQKEKKSQMMLALAERLVGGSRDKWGSKAQMENIAGGLKDIREIADPSERREMQAKYDAYWKGAKERDIDVREYETQKVRDPEFQLEELTAVKGMDRVGAINQVYGTSIRKKNKKIEKDFKKGKLPEGFIMEDEGVYSILQNGEWKPIAEEEIIKLSPRLKKKS